jgi:8-oxo-dGTP diphosphatase
MNEPKPYSLSVRALIVNDERRILILKRSIDCREYPGLWDLPGGKVEDGEKFDKALVREVKEETDLAITLKRILDKNEYETEKQRIINLYIEVENWKGELKLSTEHEEFAWITASDISNFDLVDHFTSVLETFFSENT